MNSEPNTNVFLGIDHPAVAAEDVDVLADWYVATLGYEQVFRHDIPRFSFRLRLFSARVRSPEA